MEFLMIKRMLLLCSIALLAGMVLLEQPLVAMYRRNSWDGGSSRAKDFVSNGIREAGSHLEDVANHRARELREEIERLQKVIDEPVPAKGNTSKTEYEALVANQKRKKDLATTRLNRLMNQQGNIEEAVTD